MENTATKKTVIEGLSDYQIELLRNSITFALNENEALDGTDKEIMSELWNLVDWMKIEYRI